MKEITKDQNLTSNHENYSVWDEKSIKVINVRWDNSEAKISKLEGIAKKYNLKWNREKMNRKKQTKYIFTEHQWTICKTSNSPPYRKLEFHKIGRGGGKNILKDIMA